MEMESFICSKCHKTLSIDNLIYTLQICKACAKEEILWRQGMFKKEKELLNSKVLYSKITDEEIYVLTYCHNYRKDKAKESLKASALRDKSDNFRRREFEKQEFEKKSRNNPIIKEKKEKRRVNYRRNRRPLEYNKYKYQALKRDNYKCALCSRIGHIVQVHHIVPVHINKDLLCELTNLVTLCRLCHKRAHPKGVKTLDEAIAIKLQEYILSLEGEVSNF